MKSLNQKKHQTKSAVSSTHSLLGLLKEGDAEFLLRRAENGKLKIRVGQIWRIPERRGTTNLLCDYDGCLKIDRKTINTRLRKAGIRPLSIRSRISPGGKGIHAIVTVQGRYSRIARVALQLLLESDPEREAQNFRRAMQAGKKWDEDWNILFRK